MRLSDYQSRSRATAVYPGAGENLLYPTLGLCGEAGEVAEKIKKMVRDDGGELSDERREALAKELGDVLWYVAQIATEADLDLDEIARRQPGEAPVAPAAPGPPGLRRRPLGRSRPQLTIRSGWIRIMGVGSAIASPRPRTSIPRGRHGSSLSRSSTTIAARPLRATSRNFLVRSRA